MEEVKDQRYRRGGAGFPQDNVAHMALGFGSDSYGPLRDLFQWSGRSGTVTLGGVVSSATRSPVTGCVP